MNILHITNSLSEGGVESLLYDLCSYTINEGHKVAVLVLNKNEIGLKRLFEEKGIKVIIGKYSNPYNINNIYEIRKIIKNYLVIHIHHFPCQLYASIAFSSLHGFKNKAILITTEHSTYNNRRKFSILNFLDRFFYKRYDRVICISSQTEEELKKWLSFPSLEKKIMTIRNGVNIEKFANAKNILDKTIEISSENNYIAMVGRFDPPKDQITVIKALKLCPKNTHLIFIGSGKMMEVCKKETTINNLTNRVHFIGNSKNVAGIIKGCKIGILSTLWEGFGLVAAEYMAAGIPAVASNVKGLKEVINDNDLLFNPGDYQQLSYILNKLLSDSNFYSSKVDFCKKNVLKFSVKQMSKEYINTYTALINEKIK